MLFSDYDIACIENAKKLIDDNISRHFSITAIALQVGLGKTKLKDGFKQYYGTGMFTYLRHTRMKKAMELVTGTKKTIKEIAAITGFHQPNNFIASFEKYYGITPGKARKKSSPK